MNEVKSVDRIFESATWGALFVWWGISFLPHVLPNGLDAAGTGLILLGLNAARSLRGLAINGFSTTAGILCLVWGALDLSQSVFQLPYKLPVFTILLIVLGGLLLVDALLRVRRRGSES